MSVEPPQPPAPRARALADLPLDPLVRRAEELARRWTAALIVGRTLDASVGIPLEDLAREAPSLCARMLRALESDAELRRLTAGAEASGREELGSARRLGEIAGARDAASVVAAMEALRGVLWEALAAELRWPMFDPHARLLADLADRLAYVCSTALAAAIPAALADDESAQGAPGDVIVAGGEAPATWEPPGVGAAGEPSGVVIVDERPRTTGAAGGEPARAVAPQSEPSAAPRRDARENAAVAASWEPPVPVSSMGSLLDPSPRSWESPSDRPGAGPARAPMNAGVAPDEIAIRDQRVEQGPAAWIRSIGHQLERFAQDGQPFAVLLIELMDIERLPANELSTELLRLAGQVEQALQEELRTIPDRPAASLTREAPGRFWLVAPETDGLRVRVLAEQLARAARGASRRWLPVEVAVGTALCPEDGLQAAALAAHADVALYAARAEASAGGGAAG